MNNSFKLEQTKLNKDQNCRVETNVIFKMCFLFFYLEDSWVFIINYILRKTVFSMIWATYGYFGHINNKYL